MGVCGCPSQGDVNPVGGGGLCRREQPHRRRSVGHRAQWRAALAEALVHEMLALVPDRVHVRL